MRPMLPALKAGSGNTVKAFTNASSWEYRGWAELKKVADSLDVPAPSPGKTGLDAIPDMWARVLLFANALTEEDHALHERAVGSYRGILALIALRERKHFPIEVAEIQLSASDNQKFVSALRRLLPTSSLDTGTKWDRSFVLHRKHEPFAVTSPLTLICPNEGLHVSGLSPWWVAGSRFDDPIPFLSSDERGLLAAWVSDLRTELANITPVQRSSFRLSAILAILGAFEFDLRNGSSAGVAQIAYSRNDLALSYGLYRFLCKGIKAADWSAVDSYLRLQPDRSDVGSELIIVEQSAAEQWKVKASDIPVFSGLSLADLSNFEMGRSLNRVDTLALPTGTEWRTGESFFTDKLYVVDGRESLLGTVSVTGADQVTGDRKAAPVLPIKSELLRYLKASTLAHLVQFQRLDSRIQVTLDLPVAKGRSIRVSKIYKDGDIEKLDRAPVLEIWPNFDLEGWKHYFTYWDNAGDSGAFYSKPFRFNSQLSSASDGHEVEVCRMDSAPEAFICTQRALRPTGLEEIDLGVILIALTKLNPSPGHAFNVGVDFGTTNTNVYLSTNGAGPEPLALRVVPHQVTSSEDELRSARLNKRFIPAEDTGTGNVDIAPFLSFFRTRIGASGPQYEPILQGHIHFFKPDHTVAELNAGQVHSNLKWQPGSHAKVKAYLEQICLQTCAEAVRQGASQVHWRYSLPSAFSPKVRDQFRTLWDDLRSWITVQTGVGGSGVCRQTESVAAAKYFVAAQNATPAVGMVVLDIGGGTTDISIWQRNQLAYQASIRLAGRDLLLGPIYALRKELLPVLAKLANSPSSLQGMDSITSEEQFYARLDTILKSSGDSWAKELQFVAGDPSVQRLMNKIRLGLAGLLFYVGILLRYAEKQTGFERTVQGVYIGGNGSKLFNWIGSGQFSPAAQTASLFTKSLLAGAAWPNCPKGIPIHLSREPKAEAAYGLVVSSSAFADETFDDQAGRSIPAGEPFRVEGSQLEDIDVISAERLKAGVGVGDLPNLEGFLNSYNKEEKRLGFSDDFTAAVSTTILNNVRQWTANSLDAQEENIQVDPIFIVALRELLRS